jgi:hypothetical protein
MKYIKTYEEIKYTAEQKKLTQQARYKLNKFFGGNYCGVTKYRGESKNVRTEFGIYSKYEVFTGSTMLYNVYMPSMLHEINIPNYVEKIEKIVRLMKYLGISEQYENRYDKITEEQLKNLIVMMPYIDTIGDAEKYNL